MTKLTEVDSAKHANWKVKPNCALEIVKQQHIISLKVIEVGKAVSNFPVFFTKVTNSRDWAISAILSLETNKNMFVKNDMWDAIYQPTILQTYPFYLMPSPKDEKSYTVGIDEENEAFSETEGEALFEEEGKASLYLSQVTAMLEDDLKADIHTYRFCKKLDELGLIKTVDVKVQYLDGTGNALKGLHTIDEEKLQALPLSEVEELRNKGYLAPIYAMLLSIFQLNALIRRNNLRDGQRKMKQVSIELSKDETAVQ